MMKILAALWEFLGFCAHPGGPSGRWYIRLTERKEISGWPGHFSTQVTVHLDGHLFHWSARQEVADMHRICPWVRNSVVEIVRCSWWTKLDGNHRKE